MKLIDGHNSTKASGCSNSQAEGASLLFAGLGFYQMVSIQGCCLIRASSLPFCGMFNRDHPYHGNSAVCDDDLFALQ